MKPLRCLLLPVLSVLVFVLWAMPLTGQMKSVEFLDTIPFARLPYKKASRLPADLGMGCFQLDSLCVDGPARFSHEGDGTIFSFWMPKGKGYRWFELDSRLQYKDLVTIWAQPFELGKDLYYEVIFKGETEVSCLNDGGGGHENATYFWIDAQRMRVLDFSIVNHNWWNTEPDTLGEGGIANNTERAEVTVADTGITVFLEREVFRPEPDYRRSNHELTYIYRQDKVGWIKESEKEDYY